MFALRIQERDMLKTLAVKNFTEGYRNSNNQLSQGDFMASGSSNVLAMGTGKTDIFKGLTVKLTVIGAKVMMNAGDVYVGLGAYNETGIGSVFKVLGALFFIGAGKLYYNGVDTSASATTTLSIKKFTGGSLGTTYQAGLAQPSAPTITAVAPPSGLSGKNNGIVSMQIARLRSATGGVSLASLTSNVVDATTQSIAVTFPSADANGQDYWSVYATRNGQGGIGNHYFLQEIAESVIAATITANATTDADTTIGVPNGTLTADNIGWRYTSSGDTTTYVTNVGAADSHSAGKQTITLNAASVLSTTQSATFTRAVNGTTRTYVFEWQDADLTAELAPIRNYPPPAGVFGGVLEDVVFVDGCYGDTVNVISRTDALSGGYSASNVGNTIAVSDPAKPESFPPDNYIFTGDAPTCLLSGGQGVYWRFAQNSLGVIRYVGGSPAVSYEKVWTGIGVQYQHNACLGQGGRLYAFTGGRGLVRLGQGGEPDSLFAAPIHEDIKAWTSADTKLIFDAKHQMILVMNGTTILAFYEPLGIWSAPLTVSGLGSKTIKSAVTINGDAYLAYGDNSEIKLYDFNTGTGSIGKVTTCWIPSSDISDVISRLHVALRCDNTANNVVMKVYTNGDATTAKATINYTPTATGFQFLPAIRPNVRMAKVHRVEIAFTSTGGDAGFEGIKTEGESSGITW